MGAYSFSIDLDVDRNVMYIEQRGRPSAHDLLDLKRDFLREVARLRSGFSIVNDQREMEPYGEEAMEVAKELVELTNRHGAARVIRIVPPDVLATITLSTTLMAGRSRYASIRVSSPEEAEEALAALEGGPSH